MIRFLFLICVYCLASQVISKDNLKPGDKLNSSSQLVSAKGIFTLGFYTADQTNNSYIAIYYTSDSRYPVWIGNRESPVSRNSDPVLSMDSTGKLIIMHGRHKSVEVYAGGLGKNVTATLLDTGNFIVKDTSSNGEVLWQSFDHPTDVLLPGMKLGVNHRTGTNWTLTSWFADNNPASGAFTLERDPISGKLVIRYRGIIYWTSGELMDYYTQPGNLRVKEFANFNFMPNILNFNYNFTSVVSHDEEYFRYSLITDPKQMPEQQKLISGWRLNYTGDIFDFGIGGGMTIAMASSCYGYNNEGSDKGCELREQPKCRKHHETFVLRAGYFSIVDGVSPFTYVENSSLSLSDCRDHCWKNCKCIAYTRKSKGCVYWEEKNLNFQQSLDGSNIADRLYALERPPSGKKKYVVIILVVGVAALLVFGIGLFVVWKKKRGKKEKELQELLTLEGYTENYELENAVVRNHDLRLFTYASIQSATNNFSSENKLGQGGFGPVYKGRTSEGCDIAVKLLSQQSGQGLLEFKTELVLISKLQHVNLVKLLGFCIHGNDKMIIYNYVPNKSLDAFLFDPCKRELLDWPQRFNIIQGIAQGLLYLHKYSRLKIIHRDLKPSNILLDENMKPKISDFGLARIFKHNIDEVNTNRRVGTYGYMAPEYAMEGMFSTKSDVYSFGVLVLEIVGGRKNNSFHEVEGPLNLVEHAWELWKTKSTVELMDPSLRSTCVVEQMQRCIHVGLVCVEHRAADRPNIEDIVSMLKSEKAASLPEPQNPGLVTRRRNVVVGEDEEKISSAAAKELTISQEGGR